MQDDVAYNVSPLRDDDDDDENIDDRLALQDSCARTVSYSPKRARYFLHPQRMLCFCLCVFVCLSVCLSVCMITQRVAEEF